MLLKSVPTSGDSFPNECDLVCPRKLIYIRLDAQFHTFRYSYEHSGLDLQLACIIVIPLRSICLWQVTSGPYFWNPRSKSLEIFSSCLTAFFLFGFSSIGWSKTPCPGKQPELNSFLYVKKDNGNSWEALHMEKIFRRNLDIKFSPVKFFFHARETVNNLEAAAFFVYTLTKISATPFWLVSPGQISDRIGVSQQCVNLTWISDCYNER